MGRELKRVPLDFAWPQGEIWWGYLISVPCQHAGGAKSEFGYCPICGELETEGAEVAVPLDPPDGDGYQLWETTSEGSPDSPVFTTLEELCAWCEGNATTFGSGRASAEEWREMLENDSVHHTEGCITFI